MRPPARSCGLAWLETLLALSVLSLVFQLSWPAIIAWHNRPRAGRQVPSRFDGVSGSLEYLIYLPEGYDDKKKAWPLLLFLHGAGERGRDLEKVRRHGPAALVDSGRPFQMIVVSPQCPENLNWQPKLLLELLDEIERRFSIDPARIYLTGYSMGGYGSWALAAADPSRFAAAAPLCGGGDTDWADELTNLPIWAFHGAKDHSIPLDSSQRMVNAIRSKDGNAKLTVYPDEDHNIWEITYVNPELYTWFLEQKR